MKKYALSVLHVFSIVLAVGIGMSQMGREAGMAGGVDCTHTSITSTECYILGGDVDVCTGAYLRAYTGGISDTRGLLINGYHSGVCRKTKKVEVDGKETEIVLCVGTDSATGSSGECTQVKVE